MDNNEITRKGNEKSPLPDDEFEQAVQDMKDSKGMVEKDFGVFIPKGEYDWRTKRVVPVRKRDGPVSVKTLRYRFKLKPEPLPLPYTRLLTIVEGWELTRCSEQEKYLFIFLYLTGARISEALQVRKQDIVTKVTEDKEFLSVQLITAKESRSNVLRTVLIPKFGYESRMVNMFEKDYLPKLFEEEKLFDHTKHQAWSALHKVSIGPVEAVTRDVNGAARLHYIDKFPCFPHYLRHCRLTHLKTEYQFDDQYLMRWTGWASTQMAARYVHLDLEDMARKLMQAHSQPASRLQDAERYNPPPEGR